MTPLRQEYQYTYADLLEWDEDVRYELYDGIPVALASPTDMHQAISGNANRRRLTGTESTARPIW